MGLHLPRNSTFPKKYMTRIWAVQCTILCKGNCKFMPSLKTEILNFTLGEKLKNKKKWRKIGILLKLSLYEFVGNGSSFSIHTWKTKEILFEIWLTSHHRSQGLTPDTVLPKALAKTKMRSDMIGRTNTMECGNWTWSLY
jgi:hypothetical protein